MQKLSTFIMFFLLSFFTASSNDEKTEASGKAEPSVSKDPFADDPFGGEDPFADDDTPSSGAPFANKPFDASQTVEPAKITPIPSSIFDFILTKELFSELAECDVPFKIEKSTTTKGYLCWRIIYDVKGDHETAAVLDITIAGGKEIVTDEIYEQWIEGWMEIIPEIEPDKTAAEELKKNLKSSSLGYRATFMLGIFPGGGGGVTFTTKDHLYDVDISSYVVLPKGSKYRGISIFDLAEEINNQYVEIAKE